MTQKARDARLLRMLLNARDIAPPSGVDETEWVEWFETNIARPARQVLRDLGEDVTGPAGVEEDLDERAHEAWTPPAQKAKRKSKPRAPERRSVTIRETLARAIEAADPLLGDNLDERVDSLLVMALAAHPSLRGVPA